MPPSKPTLYAKLAEVVLEVNNVEKDGHNDFQNYDYTSAEELLRAVRGPLASRNVVLVPSVQMVDERAIVTPKGKASTVTTVTVSFTFVDGETGQTHECAWAGTGDDASDKGLYKAYTGAIKTFLRNAFLLPMGDDPEGDVESDKRAAEGTSQPKPTLAHEVAALPGTVELVSAGQLEKLDTARGLLGAKRFDAKLRATGADSPGELTKEQAESVLEWGREQLAKKAA